MKKLALALSTAALAFGFNVGAAHAAWCITTGSPPDTVTVCTI